MNNIKLLNEDGSLNTEGLITPNLEDLPSSITIRSNTFTVHKNWNVTVYLIHGDDHIQLFLNDLLIANKNLNDSSSPKVSLQNTLQPGTNRVRITMINDPVGGGNWCGGHFQIGIFDENGRPTIDAIDITAAQRTNKGGVIYAFDYNFVLE